VKAREDKQQLHTLSLTGPVNGKELSLVSVVSLDSLSKETLLKVFDSTCRHLTQQVVQHTSEQKTCQCG
jgi:hypothetical protein